MSGCLLTALQRDLGQTLNRGSVRGPGLCGPFALAPPPRSHLSPGLRQSSGLNSLRSTEAEVSPGQDRDGRAQTHGPSAVTEIARFCSSPRPPGAPRDGGQLPARPGASWGAQHPGQGDGSYRAYDHVFQGVLGQPAVQEHGDEQVPQGRPEYLWRRRVRGLGLGAPPSSASCSPTVTMKGSVLIISRMKETRKICSQMLPWGPWGRKRKTGQPGGWGAGWGSGSGVG